MAPARTPPVAVKKFLRAGERGSELFPMKFLNVEFKLEHYTHATNDSATSEQKSETIFLAMHCTQLAIQIVRIPIVASKCRPDQAARAPGVESRPLLWARRSRPTGLDAAN